MSSPRRTLGSLVLDGLARFLSEDIHVLLTPSQVTFRSGESALVLRPVVTLTTGEESKILAVGESTAALEPTIEVRLFDPRSKGDGASEKFGCLEAFFRFAFSRLRGKHVMVRPFVIVRVDEGLSDLLCGYEGYLVREACLLAGARACEISVG